MAIDYPAALALRQMAMVQDELPKYLLSPEVSTLTQADFSLASLDPFVQLATLKQRPEKAVRTAGRTPVGTLAHCLVLLSDKEYVSQLDMMVTPLKIPLEHRNKRTGIMEKARIWEIIDRTVRT